MLGGGLQHGVQSGHGLARTEHMRLGTGDRHYVCLEPECGQTFRFVSDFSRHKRKTGHHDASKKAKAKK
jgi:uncharacterized C2H2 Zn-finger protein